MQISSRFTIAVHILSLLYVERDTHLTSERMAGSVNTNPVVIRQLTGLLKKAGLVGVRRGTGGAYLTKEAETITLFDVYEAVESVGESGLFHHHASPNPACRVGAGIQGVLQIILFKAQAAMEGILREVTIKEISDQIINQSASADA